MTDQELLDAAWHYKGGRLMREVFVEALGTEGAAAFKNYLASADKKLPAALHSHWLPLLGEHHKKETLAA